MLFRAEFVGIDSFADHDGSISFEEFQNLCVLFPDTDIYSILRSWQSIVEGIDVGDTSGSKPPETAHDVSNVIIAGAIGKCFPGFSSLCAHF